MKRANAVLYLVALTLTACGGAGIVTSSPSPPAPPLQTATLKGSPGFVDAHGHTVYVFDPDLATPGASTCVPSNVSASGASCPSRWPPVPELPGTVLPASWGTISRPDGITQLTFLGRPLYTFVRDTTAGAVNGDGATAFGGVFHVARPTPTGA